MKLTTQALIAGIVVFLVGASMLAWGPERIEGVATFITVSGMGLVGVKPAAHALQKKKGPGS